MSLALSNLTQCPVNVTGNLANAMALGATKAIAVSFPWGQPAFFPLVKERFSATASPSVKVAAAVEPFLAVNDEGRTIKPIGQQLKDFHIKLDSLYDPIRELVDRKYSEGRGEPLCTDWMNGCSLPRGTLVSEQLFLERLSLQLRILRSIIDRIISCHDLPFLLRIPEVFQLNEFHLLMERIAHPENTSAYGERYGAFYRRLYHVCQNVLVAEKPQCPCDPGAPRALHELLTSLDHDLQHFMIDEKLKSLLDLQLFLTEEKKGQMEQATASIFEKSIVLSSLIINNGLFG